MTSTPAKVVEYLRTIETTYTDQRVVSEIELRALVWFLLYGENVFSQVGRSWRGCSFRQSGETCSLVVKSGQGDALDIAYVTGRTPTDCVRIFCRKWHADTVQWYPDRYA